MRENRLQFSGPNRENRENCTLLVPIHCKLRFTAFRVRGTRFLAFSASSSDVKNRVFLQTPFLCRLRAIQKRVFLQTPVLCRLRAIRERCNEFDAADPKCMRETAMSHWSYTESVAVCSLGSPNLGTVKLLRMSL